MSTGRRLAKRSIIGTKVCAPGPDGLWYSGVIQDVKTPTKNSSSSATVVNNTEVDCSVAIATANVIADTGAHSADTIFIVRFDFKTQTMQADQPMSVAAAGTGPSTSKSVIMEARRAVAVAAASVHISPAQTLRRNAMIKEFRESDLIGPGFRSIMGVQLHPGQRVFLTYNGRETSGDVLQHDAENDEVTVKVTAIGTEEPIELKKRLEEVRLLESRRSARLADQDRDTDFARLADMGGDRRRASHNIDVPAALTPQHNSRKRGPSFTHDDSDGFLTQFGNDEEMNECNAALILMHLSNSPKSPKNGEKWLGSSPGSSSASWSSGSSSPPLSDDGQILSHTNSILLDAAASARIRTTSVSTSDEGIVMDYNEDAPRKRRANKPTFKCTWKGCDFIEPTAKKIERHIRNAHLGNKKARRSTDYDGNFSDSDHEEEFYYTEIEDDDDESKISSSPSQPTLSHRDMARPPHEDPEYQRQIVGNFKQGRSTQSQMANGQNNIFHNKKFNHGNGSPLNINSQQQNQHQTNQQQLQNNNTICIPTSPLAHHNYTWASTAAVAVPSATSTPTSAQQHSPVSIMKHARCSPRPSATAAPYRPYIHHHHQHHNYSSSSSSVSSNSSGSSNTSPVIHRNSNANNVLQQLSQQNVTVTAHHSENNNQQQHNNHHQQQQPQQMSAVTITPNYQQHHTTANQQQQQQLRGHQQQSPTTTASNVVANAAPQHAPHSHHTHTTTHSTQQQQHVVVQHVAAVATAKQTPNSPNRRTRGENKKCRKVYGMDRRDLWCTQCKWKKACSRFGD